MSGAEVILGVVAGGAGLASLAIQLQEKSRRIRKFYNSFRHSDERLKILIIDLETTTLLLRELESEIEAAAVTATDDLLERCIAHYRRCTSELQETTDQISNSMRRSAKLGRLSWATKERDFDVLWSKVERAKSQLQLAMQVLAYRHAKSLRSDMLALLDHADTSPPLEDHLSHRSVQSVARPCGKATARSKTYLKSCWHIKFKNWLTATIWHLAFYHTNGDWKLSLRLQNVRPYSAEVSRCCRDGDVSGLQSLITERRCSFNDMFCNSGGSRPRTILHMAAVHGQLQLCQWLLCRTAWPDCIKYLSSGLWTDENRKEAYQSFLQFSDSGVDLDLMSGKFWSSVRDTDCVDLILQSQSLPYHARPFQERFEIANRLRPGRASPALYLHAMGLTKCEHRLATMHDINGWTALHQVALGLSEPSHTHTSEWLRLGAELIRDGADENALAVQKNSIRPHSSPLLLLLLSETRLGGMLDAMETWASMLKSAGSDLEAYLTRENQLWSRLNPADGDYSLVKLGRDNQHRQLLRLVHDTQPDEWSIECRDFRILQVWELQPPVGSFPNDSRVPRVISWSPSGEDEEDGPWKLQAAYLLCGKSYEVRSRQIAADQLEAEERLLNLHDVSRIQDDSSIIIMSERHALIRNATRGLDSRKRSASFCGARKSGRAQIASFVPSQGITLGVGHDPWNEASVFEGKHWCSFSFLAEIRACQEDVSDSLHTVYQAKPAHTPGKSGCPWGCDLVHLDQLHVPHSCLEAHPKRRY